MSHQVPWGWSFEGPPEAAEHYTLRVEADGAERTLILSGGEGATRFRSVSQGISAERYRGARVRFSAEVRAAGVKRIAGLWLRADGATARDVLAFGNSFWDPLTGTSDWKRVAIVRDIPSAAERIYFGVLLEGPGELSTRRVQFESVDDSVALTPALPLEPQNLQLDL